MNWAVGFRELGWDVWLVECIARKDLTGSALPGEPSAQERFFKTSTREFGFEKQACLLVDGESPDREAFFEFAANADLLINYSGQFHRLDLLGAGVRKVYVDGDPAFTQLWAEVCGSDMNFAGHDAFLTVGTNLNGPKALLPRAGKTWIPTPPPVAAQFWRDLLGPVGEPKGDAPWTTIGHWYGFPEIEWQGRKYGGKRESFVALQDLPGKLGRPCAIATDMKPDWDDYPVFHSAGWQICSAAEVCASVRTYLGFIAASRGEIGIAKSGYVVSRAGWVSERSLMYLALGRPVVKQDTGWSEIYDLGAGMLPFNDVSGCVDAIRRVEGDYTAQSAAARGLADGVFSADRVIRNLLDLI